MAVFRYSGIKLMDIVGKFVYMLEIYSWWRLIVSHVSSNIISDDWFILHDFYEIFSAIYESFTKVFASLPVSKILDMLSFL